MFTNNLTHRITTKRLQSTGTMGKSYVVNLQDYPVMIQPMSAEYAAKLNMTFGRSYNMYTQLGADIKNSDTVIDQDGKEYRVNGSLRRNYGGGAHITFYLTEQAGANTQ